VSSLSQIDGYAAINKKITICWKETALISRLALHMKKKELVSMRVK
jgi:hypothetical protein